jgi:hypothetical protein
VSRREERLAVAAESCLVDEAEVEDAGRVDFLRLVEGFLQTKVRRIELRLVEIVVDRRPGDGIAERDFQMRLVVDEALTRASGK